MAFASRSNIEYMKSIFFYNKDWLNELASLNITFAFSSAVPWPHLAIKKSDLFLRCLDKGTRKLSGVTHFSKISDDQRTVSNCR